VADVIDITSRFKKLPPKPTVEEIAQNAIEEIGGHWEKFASNNRLNDYFLQCVPTWAQPAVNYLEDLGALSVLELKIRLEPQIIAPGFSPDNALGWVAAFRVNGIVIATPFMMSEQYARCFNILVFLKVRRDMVTNGIQLS
jgi:hypothetical protein